MKKLKNTTNKPWSEVIGYYLISGDYAKCLDEESKPYIEKYGNRFMGTEANNRTVLTFSESPFGTREVYKNGYSYFVGMDAKNTNVAYDRMGPRGFFWSNQRDTEIQFIDGLSDNPIIPIERERILKGIEFGFKTGKYCSINRRAYWSKRVAKKIDISQSKENFHPFKEACGVLCEYVIIQQLILEKAGHIKPASEKDYFRWGQNKAKYYNSLCEALLEQSPECYSSSSPYTNKHVPIIPCIANFCANAGNPVPDFFDRLKEARKNIKE